MFKALGNLLHKTPWWAIALMGLFVFLTLALFTVPFNVIRLADKGKNSVESRAIQREIDRTFGDTALTAVERVVKAMGEGTNDPARKAELDRALKDIEAARVEMFDTAADAKAESDKARSEAREQAREAKRQAKEAQRQARTEAKETAQATKEAAKQKLEELRSAREEAFAAQKRVGLNDPTALTSFDKAIAETESEIKQAEQRIKDIQSGKFKPPVTLPDPPTPPEPPEPPEPPSPSVGDGKNSTTKITHKSDHSSQPEKNNSLTMTKKGDEDSVKIDGTIGTTRIKGDITLSEPEKSVLQINGRDIDLTKASLSALTPEMRDDIRRKVSGDVRRLGIGSALIVAFIPLFIMLLIAKFYIGRSRRAIEVANVKTQEAEFANVNRQIVEAKLMALQAQVEPHFLYNTLANVQALTEVDPQQANKMTGHLIQYLRAALPKMRESISTVGQEVELVRAYLNILNMRMGDRLQFGINVPAEMEALPFPPLMLPSLVENAIKHGLEPQREGGRIDVVAEKIGHGENATIRMMVRDTGRGLTDAPVQAGGGVGLTNIRERLLALFGDKAKLTLESNQPKGVVAIIEVPATGSAAFAAPAAAALLPGTANQATEPKTWGAKTINVAARTHSVWVSLLIKVFIGIVAVLGVVFIVGMIGLATNMIPLSIGSTKVSGLESMALGTIAMLFVFGMLSIVALILIAIIYGLGFLFVGLAIGIPLLILVSAFPVLAPFVVVGFIVYWFWWRKRKKAAAVESTKA
jgi:Histidine kinase